MMQVKNRFSVIEALRMNVSGAAIALRENGSRSLLTILGIIIGVGSVVLLIGIGQGVKDDVGRQIEDLGVDTVFILPGKLDKNGQPNMMSTLGISTLTDADVRDLAGISGVKLTVPLMFVFGAIERDKQSFSTAVVATTPQIFAIRSRPLQSGRLFQPGDANANVCILAGAPKTEIFGTRDALGQTVYIKRKPFRVIGVLAPEEDSLFAQASFSNVVYLPLDAARRALHGGQINRILMKLNHNRPPEEVLRDVKKKLLDNHNGAEDFGILTQKQLLGTVYKIFNIVTALLVGISAISLVVAGIGIMNIMLVTVTERTREIGIRKTVGAKRSDIFIQFLSESVFLSVSGGFIGTLFAVFVCRCVALYSPLKPMITPHAIMLAFFVCLAVGVVFGVVPAMRAARQNPIDSLRWE